MVETRFTGEDLHRIKALEVAPQLLVEILKGGSFLADPTLPKDAEVRGVFLDHETGLIIIHVFSREYPSQMYRVEKIGCPNRPKIKHGGDSSKLGTDLDCSWGLRMTTEPEPNGRRILLQEEGDHG